MVLFVALIVLASSAFAARIEHTVCVGGCSLAKVHQAACVRNANYTWHCEADLPRKVKFDQAIVSCDDGPCALIYSLKLMTPPSDTEVMFSLALGVAVIMAPAVFTFVFIYLSALFRKAQIMSKPVSVSEE